MITKFMIKKSIKCYVIKRFIALSSTKYKNLTSWVFCRVGILKILDFFDKTRECINLRDGRHERRDKMSKLKLSDVLSYRYYVFPLINERLYK